MMWRQRDLGGPIPASRSTSTPERAPELAASGARPVSSALTLPRPSGTRTAAATASATQGGGREHVAMARLAWALGRTLHLVRQSYASMGRAAADIGAIEDALAQARMPEEYIEIAKRIAGVAAPPGVPSTQSAMVLSTFRRALTTVARAVLAENVVAELEGLSDRYDVEGDVDPQPLLTALEHLAEMVARSRESSDVLHDALAGVQNGIRKIADDEESAHVRIRQTRERIEAANETTELMVFKTMLLTESERLEVVLEERRAALDALEKQSRSARRRAARLIAALADATTAAATDILTGLGNRRAMERAVETLATTGQPVGVLVLDIDHFKVVNDTHGHGVGDRVLTHVAEMLQCELRGDDQGFRTGGEEFVILLSDCDHAGAIRTAERIRTRIERTPAAVLGKAIRVTVSAGVTAWTPTTPFAQAVERADGALYDAKRGGRNRCIAVASP